MPTTDGSAIQAVAPSDVFSSWQSVTQTDVSSKVEEQESTLKGIVVGRTAVVYPIKIFAAISAAFQQEKFS
jgi:hypothetical protein